MIRAIWMLVGLALLTLASCGDGGFNGSATADQKPEQAPTTGLETAEWNTYSNDERGLEATYPSDWYRADERLTPNLGDPLEILSLGTYPLRPGGDRCAHFPVNALDDLGPDDAFISVLERAAPFPASDDPPRPSRFELPTDSGTDRFCVVSDERRDDWVPFSDAGRAFYLLVAVGDSASEETRTELLTILNSLNFEEGG